MAEPRPTRFAANIAVHVLLIEGCKVLMQLRQGTEHDTGLWSVPGGHLEGGERATDAAAREVLEEVGVVVEPRDLRFLNVTHRRQGGKEWINLFFEADNWTGEPWNKEASRSSQVAWQPLQSLPLRVVPYVLSVLLQGRDPASYTEAGWD